jgi:hypothetical protein
MILSSSEFEIVIEEFERYKSLGTDLIASELIQAGNETLCSAIRRFINFIRNKVKLLQQCNESSRPTVPRSVYRVIQKSLCTYTRPVWHA